MLERLRYSTLQKGLVLFWAIWLSIVVATNFTDALKELGVLPDSWKWASYNFDLVTSTVGAHGVPVAGAVVLYAGVVLWELLAAGLLWRAFRALLRSGAGTSAEVTQAFVVNLALWSAFLIATELTVNFATAATHKSTFIAQLLTLLVIRAGAQATTPMDARTDRVGV